jgi:hypothetical protein
MDDTTRHNLIQQLGAAMSDVSENCYCAGWLGGTADVLPELCRRAIETGQAQRWGHGEVTPETARNLWAMAERPGAWADLHPQDDSYVPYQPFPRRAGVAEDMDREQSPPPLHRRMGGAG